MQVVASPPVGRGAAEQPDGADEAGPSYGASPLIRAVRQRANEESVRSEMVTKEKMAAA
jgi:hypothetical protein